MPADPTDGLAIKELLSQIGLLGMAPEILFRIHQALKPHFEGGAAPEVSIFISRGERAAEPPAAAWNFFLVTLGESPEKHLELYLYQ